MKTIYFSLFFLLSSLSFAQQSNNEKFNNYISKFKESSADSEQLSGVSNITSEEVKLFVDSEINTNKVHFSRVCLYEHKGFFVAFLYEHHDGSYLSTIEQSYSYDDLIMIVYSKEGQILSKQTLGRLSLINSCRINENLFWKESELQKFDITVEREDIADVFCDYHIEKENLCNVSVKKYTIDDDGKIVVEVISEKQEMREYTPVLV